MKLFAVLVLGSTLAQTAFGRDVVRSDCPERAVRVLAIGGEIQPNAWSGPCDKSTGKKNNGRHLGWAKQQERQAQERAEYSRLKEAARRKEDDKKKSEESKRKATEQKRSEISKGKTNGRE